MFKQVINLEVQGETPCLTRICAVFYIAGLLILSSNSYYCFYF